MSLEMRHPGDQELLYEAAASTESEDIAEKSTQKFQPKVWQLCRVCARPDDCMVQIFQNDGQQCDLAEKIKKYLPILVEESDRLPLQMCKACEFALEACHELTECCRQADVTLRRLLQEEDDLGLICQVNTTKVVNISASITSQVDPNICDIGQASNSVHLADSWSIDEIDHVALDSSDSSSEHPTKTLQQRPKQRRSARHELKRGQPDVPTLSTRLASEQNCLSMTVNAKQFSCWDCGTSLEDLSTFMQHQKQVHSRDLFSCKICENMFETESELATHQETEHKKTAQQTLRSSTRVKKKSLASPPPVKKRTRARASQKSSVKINKKQPTEKPAKLTKRQVKAPVIEHDENDSASSYSDHSLDRDELYLPNEKVELKVSAYQCKVCSKGYESKSGRRNHYVSAHNKYECKVCEELFLTSEEAEQHEKQPHKIACTQCPEYFQSQSSLKMHVSSKHLEGPKQYKCSQCGRDYVSKSALLTHEKLHKIKEPSICDVCNKSCKTPTALKYHKFVHMTDEEKTKVGFACTMCEKKFPGKTRLTLHMRRHTDERPCECPTCHKTFHDSERLKAHMEGHSTEKRFKCDQCDACFVSKRYLVNHMYLSHRRRQVIRCIVCKLVFPSMKEVMNHQRTHTAEEIAQTNCGNQPFTKSIEFHCKECNEYFSRKDLLRLHKARFHAKERVPTKSNVPIKQLECKLCGKKVWGTAGLGRHMRVHSEDAPVRTFQCEFCAKLFAQKMQMVLHIRTHTGEKPFTCQFCEKGFINVNSLVVHERIHTGETPFQCDKCPKAFRSNSNLVAHLQTHSDVKPYECHYCRKRFGRLIHLKLHLRTHTGERPYVCDICGRAFTQGGDMRKHRLTHTGERAYKCNMCDFSSNKRKALSEHQVALHVNALPCMPPTLNVEILPPPENEMQIVNVQSLATATEYVQSSSSYLKMYENWSEN